MENKASYVLLGVFVFLIFIGGMIFILWLGKYSNSEDYVRYRINTQESISGLNKKAPVKLLGVDIGEVENVFINANNPEEVSIVIKIKAQTPVKENTYAIIEFQGITGLKYLQLKGGTEDSPSLKTSNKIENMAIIKTKPSFISNFDNTFDKIIVQSDALVESLQKISINVEKLASDKNIKNLETILENTASFSDSINIFAKNANETATKLSKMSDSVSLLANEGGIKMVKSIKETSDDFKKLSDALQKKVENFDLNSQKSLDSFNEMLNNINKLSDVATSFIEQLRLSPSDILYKTAKQKPGPGEEK